MRASGRRTMCAGDRELMCQVLLPAALPQIPTGLQAALPLSLTVAVGYCMIKLMSILRRRLLLWHQEALDPTTA